MIRVASFRERGTAIKPSSGYVRLPEPTFSANTIFNHDLPQAEVFSLGLRVKHVEGTCNLQLFDSAARLTLSFAADGRLTVSGSTDNSFYLEANLTSKDMLISFEVNADKFSAFINGYKFAENTYQRPSQAPHIRFNVTGAASCVILDMYVKHGSLQENWDVVPAKFSQEDGEVIKYSPEDEVIDGSFIIERELAFEPDRILSVTAGKSEDLILNLDRVKVEDYSNSPISVRGEPLEISEMGNAVTIEISKTIIV